MEDSTALFCNKNCRILSKSLLVGKHIFEKLGIRMHLQNSIQEWDISMKLLEYHQRFLEFSFKLGLGYPLGKINWWFVWLNGLGLGLGLGALMI